MDRIVELSYNTAKWKTVAAFVGTYSVTYLGMTLLSPDSIELWPHALMFFCVLLGFLASSMFKRNPLTLRDGDIYLKGIKAELNLKQSLLGYQYIQVTALTERGYHRIKVFKHHVVVDDWLYLSGQCT
ncbi:hypothetical protein BCU70_12910 [Vibrio sp. 10N.286.49.C2]|uniref:hypothetical protein n=1 Tax=unclassified Vibrio TaxID=2614977 RepID=UPI000C8669D1|nr:MULTISPECIES: hypothetical protein [unclassified Vibrio]PMH39283.1 hypothetical protein BCU70_12910 [Vibrio sp. 10N.286.49.C2]PMH54369.1 hypothetical protein BCU66_12055 [Vibrio sp. 10N.286.49.B1]PMH78460.1 hypothetical protein BCU58_00825 [Vibrio sp. 10N.286.48.B7]